MGTLMTPTSRGTVTISSSSMHDAPIIDPKWMTTNEDLEVMVAIVKRMRQVWSTSAVKKITIGEEAWPGAKVKTDKDIIAFLKQTATPMSHATSTNKMGKKDDPLAVVDSQCKVIGVKNCEYQVATIPSRRDARLTSRKCVSSMALHFHSCRRARHLNLRSVSWSNHHQIGVLTSSRHVSREDCRRHKAGTLSSWRYFLS